jgi:hypothetical protein
VAEESDAAAPDARYADPHLEARFFKLTGVLGALRHTGIEPRSALTLGLCYAPRAWDRRAFERARERTHANRIAAVPRGGDCECLWCLTFERASLNPEGTPSTTACPCCEAVATELIACSLTAVLPGAPSAIARHLKEDRVFLPKFSAACGDLSRVHAAV